MHTFEENIVRILQYCRMKHRTLHNIKDTFSLGGNERFKKYISFLLLENLIIININNRDGRGTRQILTSEKGKALLREKGLKY